MRFDAYLAVDWSARSRPSPARPTADSIWIGDLCDCQFHERNPRTRHAARELIESRLAEHVGAGRRVLVGFDFALGYPAGFARSIGLTASELPTSGQAGSGPAAPGPWSAVWGELERLIVDGPDNGNNRFEVAAALNARCGGAIPGPFWGCPLDRRSPTLEHVSPAYPYPAGSALLQRMRWTDRRGVQPVWKLYGNGSVGSQTLLGIPVVAHLRSVFPDSRVWPLETGFTAGSAPVVYAEIWPTSASAWQEAGVPVKDQRQVRSVLAWLSTVDAEGDLAALFGPPEGPPDAAVAAAVEEEGWILGL